MFHNVLRYRNQILITICGYVGHLLCGYGISWTAPIIPKLENPDESPLSRPLSDIEMSLLASVLYIAGLPAVLSMSWFSNFKGRKASYVLSATFYIIGFAMLGSATNFTMMFIARIINTFGFSIANMINTIYIGEIASSNIRGIFLTGLGVIQTLGSLILFSVGPFVSYSMVSYIGVAISAVYFLAVLCIPESPVYLALKDEDKKLSQVLQILGRESEIENIMELKNTQVKTNDLEDWKELFTLKCNRKALFITVTISVLNYLSGILVVVFFSTSIFKMADSSVPPSLATIIIGCTQLVGSVIAPLCVEISGRRILLLVSTGVCCVSMVVFGFHFFLIYINSPLVEHIKWLPLASLVIFFMSNNMGFGVIPSTLTGELFNSNVRSKGTATVFVVSWISGFIITTIFNTLISSVGAYAVFWFFSFTCGLAFLFTLFFIPETKGKSLIEIQEILSK
ncbi:facilitated trehalose transporter Tret1-like [Pieris brassicae]|uniref:Major facilitator superfamily (MFS) profile domain-containing protein n=1 Tax=Pieris brassicae TaxID=7116 RepID=A0A9P0XED9_PIEBR|nr:facilitated trehalose transporter Tret1-like [Pieris brassicae]CAH4035295.1 unnamed protein product [Pieris brassicae]